MNLTYTISPRALAIFEEPSFMLFKEGGLWCVVQRLMWSGTLNGYAAVGDWHPLYGKGYDDDAVEGKLEVHGGITFARGYLPGIEGDLLGKLWWFGFDTMHCEDLKPFHSEIDRKYAPFHDPDQYRDFTYVKAQTIKLAQQLLALL